MKEITVKIHFRDWIKEYEYHEYDKEFSFEYDDNTKFIDLINYIYNKYKIDGALINGNIDGLNGEFIVKYILKDGVVKWCVPLEDCTLDDYITTYSANDCIQLLKVDGIGGDTLDFLTLISTIVDAFKPLVEFTDTLGAIFLIGSFLKWIYGTKLFLKIRLKLFAKHFKEQNGYYIPDSYIEYFVKSRKYWDLDGFMKICQVKDKEIAVLLLYNFGYYQHGNLYKYDSKLEEANLEIFNETLNKNSK